MKLVKNILLLFVFLTIGTAGIAQQQCAVKLTDGTPSGPYTAILHVIYNGTPESTLSPVTLTLNATTYIPFSIVNDVSTNVYRVIIELYDNSGFVGYYPSALFNTNYWRYNNINVSIDLP